MSSADLTRQRLSRIALRTDDDAPPPPGCAAFVGQVAAGSSPSVGEFFLVNPVTVGGAEVLGGAGDFDAGAAAVPVYLVGPGTPGVGDMLVCRSVDFRWVAEFQGGCRLCLTALGGPYGYLPGSDVVISQDGTTFCTGTTDSSGTFCCSVPAPGVYTATITHPSFMTETVTVFACVPCSCYYPKVLSAVIAPQVVYAFLGFASHPYLDAAYPGPSSPPPYTLTYGPRPSDVPKTISVQTPTGPPAGRGDLVAEMPDSAWFSAEFAITIAGNPGFTGCWYGWVSGCTFHVAFLVNLPIFTGAPPTWYAVEPENPYSGPITTCDPFEIDGFWTPFSGFGLPTSGVITGSHGSDDLPPPVPPPPFGNGLGGYFNKRYGPGTTVPTARPVPYILNMLLSGVTFSGGTYHGHVGTPITANIDSPNGLAANNLTNGYIPPGPVAWVSSDTSVLTVASSSTNTGLQSITPVGVGSAIITASFTDTLAVDGSLAAISLLSQHITIS